VGYGMQTNIKDTEVCIIMVGVSNILLIWKILPG